MTQKKRIRLSFQEQLAIGGWLRENSDNLVGLGFIKIAEMYNQTHETDLSHQHFRTVAEGYGLTPKFSAKVIRPHRGKAVKLKDLVVRVIELEDKVQGGNLLERVDFLEDENCQIATVLEVVCNRLGIETKKILDALGDFKKP